MATTVETQRGRGDPPAIPQRMTLQEFLDYPWGDTRAELVEGEVKLLNPPASVHSWIVSEIYEALVFHLRGRQLGKAFGDGTGYTIRHRRDTARGPDVSFVRAGRITFPLPERGIFDFAPDFAVEVLSAEDRYSEAREKLAEYLAAGSTLAWLVAPRRRGVEVHVPGAGPRWVAEHETLDGAPVLPDFRLRVADIFAAIPRMR